MVVLLVVGVAGASNSGLGVGLARLGSVHLFVGLSLAG
jgi:hypothetical protein